MIDQVYRGCGSQPYDPVPLLKMVLLQYLQGQLSPAKWFREAALHEAMQWLGRGYTPARRTWYDFRDRADKFIHLIHAQIMQQAAVEARFDPTIAALDGTTIAACASRHRVVNQPTLEQRTTVLTQVIAGEPVDPVPRWVPPTDSGRNDLARRMQQATQVLADRIARNAKKPSGKRQDPQKIHVSVSDPTAALGRDKC